VITPRITSFTKTLIESQVTEDVVGSRRREVGSQSDVVVETLFTSLGDSPVIDIRSRSEFLKGSVPGSINVPMFSDSERAQIGTAYKERSPAEAFSLAIGFFEDNYGEFLASMGRTANSGRIFLLCARGGLRSKSVAYLLSHLGFDVRRVAGGYKSYRHFVLSLMSSFAKHELLVFHGRTGVGKTAFLREMEKKSCGVVDFEALACHRGSAFGDVGLGRAPISQQLFENRIAARYFEVRRHGTILVELENFLGSVSVPQCLRERFKASRGLLLRRDYGDRIARLEDEYADAADTNAHAELAERLIALDRVFSSQQIAVMVEKIAAGCFGFVARSLLARRYDTLYDRSLSRYGSEIKASFNLSYEKSRAEAWVLGHVRRSEVPAVEMC